jgi:hypothetical protein
VAKSKATKIATRTLDSIPAVGAYYDPRSCPLEVAMLMKDQITNDLISPVAILDKEIRKTSSFRIEIFEVCTLCGARFGIGYFGFSKEDLKPVEEIEDLPRKLIDILAKDHWHHREHKGFIELDV